jgi:hypothetical protein
MTRQSVSTSRTRNGTRTIRGSRSQRPPSLKPALSRDSLQAALAAPCDFQSPVNPTAF